MSFLRTSRLLSLRTTPSTRFLQRKATLAFSTSVSRFAGKESAVHEDAEKRGQEVEDAKNDQKRAAQQTGEGKFKEELTSDSEDAVKADKGQMPNDAGKDIEDLQKATKGKPEEKHGQ